MTVGLGRLGLTGATGYIGQAVIRVASSHEWEVVSIGRRQAVGTLAHRHADLSQPLDRDLLHGLDAVMHLAATADGGSSSGVRFECEFAQSLASSCAEAGIPFLFTSSQAAATDAPSQYGRTKAIIEEAILPLSAIVVRPGLVYGGVPAGLFDVVIKLVHRLPLLPDLRPRPLVQPIHIDDLANALFSALKNTDASGKILAVAGPAVSFRDFVDGIATWRSGMRRFWLPIPVWFLRLLLKIGHGVIDKRLSPERLDSLVQFRPMNGAADLQELGVQLRDMRDGLSRSGRGRRRLLGEARAMTRALLGRRKPPYGLLKRYVKAIESQCGGGPMEPASLHPWLLSSLDTPAARRGGDGVDVAERLNIMSRLAESETAFVDAYLLLPGRSGRIRMLVEIAKVGLLEVLARLSAPYARRRLRGSIHG